MFDYQPPPRTRKRIHYPYGVDVLVPIGTSTTTDRKGVVIAQGSVAVNSSKLYHYEEQCTDQVHKKTNGRYIDGGPLDIARIRYNSEMIQVNPKTVGGIVNYEYSGSILAHFTSNAPEISTVLPPRSFGDCWSYGATAWKMYKPGKPKVGLAEAIAELRDLPKMLRQSTRSIMEQLGSVRKSGSTYLNIQFGWRPLLSDIQDMLNLVSNIDRELDKLSRANGKWVRRKGTVFETATTTHWEHSGLAGNGWAALPNGALIEVYPHSQGTLRKGRRVWFSGSFRYWIPDIDSYRTNKWRRRDLVRRLMGLTISPEVVWNLIPWSWLIDYFGNVGDLISNLTDGTVDNLAARYAYVLGTTETKHEQTSYVTLKNWGQVQSSVTLERTYKIRQDCSPFGFGIAEGGLTPFQLSILAALGLTKFR